MTMWGAMAAGLQGFSEGQEAQRARTKQEAMQAAKLAFDAGDFDSAGKALSTLGINIDLGNLKKEQAIKGLSDLQALASKSGSYDSAAAFIPKIIESRNAITGRQDVGPKLVGTYGTKPDPNWQATGPVQWLTPDMQPTNQAPTVVDPTKYDPNNIDENNPANQKLITSLTQFAPPAPQYKSFNQGDYVFEIDPITGKRKSGFQVPYADNPFKMTAEERIALAKLAEEGKSARFTTSEENKDKRQGRALDAKTTQQAAKVTDADLRKEAETLWGKAQPVDKTGGTDSTGRPIADGMADNMDGVPMPQAIQAWETGVDTIFQDLKRKRDLQQNGAPGRDDPFARPSRGGGGGTIKGKWSREIGAAASRHGVPAEVVQAVMMAESGGNPKARSPVGAIGLMQLMPGTAQGLGVDPNDPLQNLEGGVRYLKAMFDKFGRWDLALAAYNAGPGAVERHGGIPPYKETQNYVRKILGKLPAQQSAAPDEDGEAELMAFYEKHGITPGGGYDQA